jgi:hypothetical protein
MLEPPNSRLFGKGTATQMLKELSAEQPRNVFAETRLLMKKELHQKTATSEAAPNPSTKVNVT